ncbi:hypothetical protein L6452_01265 [Arctium lappa]|uniref:Uncharacterized protein n=1 Tax=Arctium lappa TaxID=4217 RepID=A0ACB9FGU7_ARCLA|nr:hypothetical protein L6452_01265 [Arctium lappa]
MKMKKMAKAKQEETLGFGEFDNQTILGLPNLPAVVTVTVNPLTTKIERLKRHWLEVCGDENRVVEDAPVNVAIRRSDEVDL